MVIFLGGVIYVKYREGTVLGLSFGLGVGYGSFYSFFRLVFAGISWAVRTYRVCYKNSRVVRVWSSI